MTDKNRNWGNQSNQSNEDWDRNRRRYNQEDEYRNKEDYGNYGNVGYDNDYNRNQSTRGYGDRDSNRDMGNQRYSNTGGSGGYYGSDYARDYDTNGGYRDSQNWQNTGSSRNQYGREKEWRNEDWNKNDWNSGSFGREDWRRTNMSGNYQNDFRRGYGNEYGSQYGQANYGQDRRRNIYGDDTSNYGNANQGGFDRGWWDRTRDEVSSWFGDEDADRRRRMDRQNMTNHRGKGPKDYHRSEDRIREDVCDRLTDDSALDATNINVQIQGDEVVLTGTVNSRDQKRRAEDVVESISGVRNVENRLRVNNDESSFGSSQTMSSLRTSTEKKNETR